MASWRTVVVAAVLGLVSFVLLWTDVVPLGVPGEWTWSRLEHTPLALVWHLGAIGLAGAIYLAFAWYGERHIEQTQRFGMFGRLTLLTLISGIWLGAMQSAAVEGVGSGKGPFVLFSNARSGYFQQARYDVASTREFLAGYEESISVRGDDMPSDIYLHIGTHPPGLTLCFVGLLELCETFPSLVDALLWSQSDSVRMSFREVAHVARLDDKPFGPTDAACLWLATLLVQWSTALTVVPLYLWLRVDQSRETSWRTAVFWPLIPAAAIFLPKSDVLFTVIVMTAAWLWRSGWVDGRPVRCLLSGTVLFSGMFLSLAFLPVAALMAVQTVLDGWPQRGVGNARWLASFRWIGIGAAGFFAPAVLLGLGTGFNVVSVWWWNFHNHALFYDHFTRTAWKWWLVNPLELSLAVGLPVMVIFLRSTTGSIASLRHSTHWKTSGLAVSVVWTLLWLSGKNMGEAARLWVFLMPWIVAGCAAALARENNSTRSLEQTSTDRALHRRWMLLLSMQLAISAATVLRIDAFEFGELLRRASS